MSTALRWLLLIGVLHAPGAIAHSLSDAELHLKPGPDHIQLQLSVPLRDLAAVLPLDLDGDRQLRWGELRASSDLIQAYLDDKFALRADGEPCPVFLQDVLLSDEREGPAAWLDLHAGCGWPLQRLTLDYRLLFEYDPSHRGVLILTDPGGASASFVASPRSSRWQHVVAEPGAGLTTLLSYLKTGIEHIWIGIDHLLFIAVLLLPCVLDRQRRPAAPGPVFQRVAWLITAFTLAHSLTLAAGILGWVQPSIGWIEVGIAASVVLAALNNIFGWVTRYDMLMAFGFGLLHGFGFAAVLTDFGLPSGSLGFALAGFNLGVEVGQLLLVAAALPLLLVLARRMDYHRLLLRGGSAAAALLAGTWMLERAAPLL